MTVTAVMMSVNYDQMAPLAQVAATVGANLRVNVYQPSKTDQFTLSYAQFWDGFKRLAAATRLIATKNLSWRVYWGWKDLSDQPVAARRCG